MLTDQDARRFFEAIISSGLADKRLALLAQVSPNFAATLPQAQSPSEQIWLDIHIMRSAGALADGTVPLVQMIEAAKALSGGRAELALFSNLLRQLGDFAPRYRLCTDLIALGNRILGEGELSSSRRGTWIITIRHFLIGGPSEVSKFAEQFDAVSIRDRYVLMSSGDGRLLAEAPTWSGDGASIRVEATISTVRERQSVHSVRLPTMDSKTVTGINAAVQEIRSSLEFLESARCPGSRLRWLCERLGDASRIEQLIKLELIRMSTVPRSNNWPCALGFIQRVNSVKVQHDPTDFGRMGVGLDLDFVGFGSWSGEVEIVVPLHDLAPGECTASAGTSGLEELAQDIDAWLAAIIHACSGTAVARDQLDMILQPHLTTLRSMDRSIRAQSLRAKLFADRAIHTDLPSLYGPLEELSAIRTLTDYESSASASFSLSRLMAKMIEIDDDVDIDAISLAQDAARAAANVRPAAAAAAAAHTLIAVTTKCVDPFSSDWWSRVEQYVTDFIGVLSGQ